MERWEERRWVASSPLQITSSPKICRSGKDAIFASVSLMTTALPTLIPPALRTTMWGA
jgi:hypothetical protein